LDLFTYFPHSAAIFSFSFILGAIVFTSSRRGRPHSGDIDILLTHPDFVLEKADPLRILQSVIGELNKRKYLLADLANGIHQYMGVCRLVCLLFLIAILVLFYRSCV
jgi:hypothetical protein